MHFSSNDGKMRGNTGRSAETKGFVGRMIEQMNKPFEASAAEEQVEAQDWTGREKPCAVQVALARIREEKRQ